MRIYKKQQQNTIISSFPTYYQREEPEPEPEPEPETFVSVAEKFIEADTDKDGTLSVEELSKATGLSLEETKELHSKADVDNDGSLSLSEVIASPAGEKLSSLPKPISPVRKPVNKREPVTPQEVMNQQPIVQPHQQPVQQHPQYPQPQPQPIQRPQPVNPQPWNQPVQPTIRSGVLCRGCGIGLDPYWRYCPICGGQNLG